MNIEQYRLRQGVPLADQKPSSRHRACTGKIPGKFLKGPIPWLWLAAAGSLPGHALHVGVALWMQSGIDKNDTVRLSQKNLREMGVNRHSVYRALGALERADLVSVVRHSGRLPVVTINKEAGGLAGGEEGGGQENVLG